MIIKIKKNTHLETQIKIDVVDAFNKRNCNVNATHAYICESDAFQFRITQKEIRKILESSNISTKKRGQKCL